MRTALAILLGIIWLLLGIFYYNSSSCYCNDNAQTNDKTTLVSDSLATATSQQSDKTPSIFQDPDNEKEITFANSSSEPIFSSNWTNTKDSILERFTDEYILRITGKYGLTETNNSDAENLGIARAMALQKELNLTDEQVQLLSKTMDDEIVQQEKFEALSFDLRKNTMAIDETSIENKIVIRFPYNSEDRISDPKIEDYLNQVASYMKSSTNTITIVGHTDNLGTSEYNETLGLARANAIKSYLVSKGAKADQIVTSSKGETQPLASNNTDAGRAINRRAELTLNK